MKVEIWSDVVCPFCYIGKRRFEQALQEFGQRDQVEIEWKSYQLMPDFVPVQGQNLDEMLASEKGIPHDRAKAMNRYASGMAQQAGLTYNLDKVIPANTSKAHSLIHFAKERGRQEEMAEALFRAYFTEGKDIGDLESLMALAESVGLNPQEVKDALASGKYTDRVTADINEAQSLGVQGVPFFVFNRKAAVSGAQDPEIFLQALNEAQE